MAQRTQPIPQQSVFCAPSKNSQGNPHKTVAGRNLRPDCSGERSLNKGLFRMVDKSCVTNFHSTLHA